MQFNLQKIQIVEIFKYLGWILLFIVLWFKGCSSGGQLAVSKITVPEVKGKLETKKPDHAPVAWPEKDQPKPVIKWRDKEILIENPINTTLANQYIMAKDSLERLNLYLKSIQLNSFSSKFEDDNLLLNIKGIVQGEVQEITPSYTIKEKTIPVQLKQKQTVFRLLAGAELGNTTLLDDFCVKGNLMFQNKKGNIGSLSFDTDQRIWIGFSKSIFDVKR